MRCDSPPESVLDAAVEAEVVEPDAEQQIQPAANVLQHLAAGVGAAARRLDRGQEALQLVEVQLAELVDVAAVDREQQARRAHARALALRARALDHHLVEPLLHPRVRLASLAVAPVVPLDPPGDAVKADLASVRTAAQHLRVRRRHHLDLRRAEAVEDGLARRFRQRLPRGVEREVQQRRQAEHHPPVPRVRVVLERLAHEAAAEDAALGVRHEQVRMRQLVHAEAAAGAARALGIVELKIRRARCRRTQDDASRCTCPCRTGRRRPCPRP